MLSQCFDAVVLLLLSPDLDMIFFLKKRESFINMYNRNIFCLVRTLAFITVLHRHTLRMRQKGREVLVVW